MKNEIRKNVSWRLWSLDVWGNDQDGYDVNDRSELMKDFRMPLIVTDEEIVNTLKLAGFIDKWIQPSDINIDGDDGTLYIDQASNGFPLFQLELND